MQRIKMQVDKAHLCLSKFNIDKCSEIHLVAQAATAGSFEQQLQAIVVALENYCGQNSLAAQHLIFARFFVSDIANQKDWLKALQQSPPAIFSQCAKSIVQQPSAGQCKLQVWLYLIKDDSPTVAGNKQQNNGQLLLMREDYHHFWHTEIVSTNGSHDSWDQTKDVFTDLRNKLADHSLTLKDHCLRTWLFVKDIDFNYKGVVDSRRKLFAQLNMVRDTHYIASTGIEGRHIDPRVNVVLDAYSVGGIHQHQIKHLTAPSHLNPTHEYGVTFERGTSISYGDRRHIFISGTASIDRRGEILHENDVARQIERTMDNIAALLEDGQAVFNDIAQMIVYVRDPSDIPFLSQYMEAHCPKVPKVVVHAPVCRPGWLVEVECLAISAIRCSDFPNF